MCNEKKKKYNEETFCNEKGVYEVSYNWDVARISFVRLNGEIKENDRHIVGTRYEGDILIPIDVIAEMKALADAAVTYDIIKDSK